MNRREFLKSALTIAAMTPVAHLAGAAKTSDGIMKNTPVSEQQVTRRPYKDSFMTLPLLGFGLMRLPQKNGKVDYPTAEAMVAKAMKAGCNYFDTAYMYHNGESEKFVGQALSKYPRDSYFLVSKMPIIMMNSEADNARIFNEQLARTRAGYFDFYFLHWLNETHWEKAQKLKTLEFMKKNAV